MIVHTPSLKHFRTHGQSFFEFAVLTCTDVPNLGHLIKTSPNTLLKTDYFHVLDSPSQLNAAIAICQEQLARTTVITLFSFFEAYVVGILDDILKFHGGGDAFKKTADRRTKKFLSTPGIQRLRCEKN